MPTTSIERLVKAWEAGRALPHTARAIELLMAMAPETPRSVAASLSLGERDRRLLVLRRALFGPVLDATVVCPHCRERVEFAVDVESLLVSTPDASARAFVEVDGETVEVRPPTSTDLLELARSPSGLTELTVIERCVTRMTSDGKDTAVSVGALSQASRAAVDAKMADLDPQADIQLSMACPVCRHQWSADLDVVSYVWAELNSWIRQLLVDVHRLASAYGWRESDILALSGERRSAYLEMIGA